MATETPAIKQIASGLRFPEGPMAMPDGSVILVEIERQTLSRVTPDGKVHVIAALGGGPNGAAMGPGGKIYVTNNGGFNWMVRPGKTFPITQADDYKGGSIQIVDPETGKFETLYDACDGRRLRGPNDLVFDGAGGFWFTDLGKTRERDSDRGAVYYARADGSQDRGGHLPARAAQRHRAVAGRRDALRGRDADGALLVVPALRARAASSPRTGRTAARRARSSSGSAATRCSTRWPWTTTGHICVATLITGAVSDIWPDGSRVDQYVLPDMMVTNVCFGGPELRTAFATLSMGGTLVSFEWPRPGLAASPSEPVERTARMALDGPLWLARLDLVRRRRRAVPGRGWTISSPMASTRTRASPRRWRRMRAFALAHAAAALLALCRATARRRRPASPARATSWEARPGASGSTSRRCPHSSAGETARGLALVDEHLKEFPARRAPRQPGQQHHRLRRARGPRGVPPGLPRAPRPGLRRRLVVPVRAGVHVSRDGALRRVAPAVRALARAVSGQRQREPQHRPRPLRGRRQRRRRGIPRRRGSPATTAARRFTATSRGTSRCSSCTAAGPPARSRSTSATSCGGTIRAWR